MLPGKATSQTPLLQEPLLAGPDAAAVAAGAIERQVTGGESPASCGEQLLPRKWTRCRCE